jgi:hypothetical protein
MTVASCYCVIHLYVIPLLVSRYFHQCRKCSASVASVEYGDHADGACKERGVHCFPIFMGTKCGTCKHSQDCGHTQCMCDVSWTRSEMLHDFTSGSVNVMDKDRSGCLSASNSVISDVEMVLVDRCVPLQQLHLSHGFVWDTVHEYFGYCKVCSRWVAEQLANQHEVDSIATSLTNLQHYEAEGSDFLLCTVTAMRYQCTTAVWIWRMNPWYRSIPHCLQRSS